MWGFYSWSWGLGSVGPPNANVAIAFTGYPLVEDALSAYDTSASWCCPELDGPKMLAIGGGLNVDDIGAITDTALVDITRQASLIAIKSKGYIGVVFNFGEVEGSFEEIDELSRLTF